MIWTALSRRLPPDVADDLTQHVLLTIFTKLEGFVPWHDDDAFERWVIVIYSRAARSHSSARCKAPVIPDPDVVERLTDAGAGPSTQLRNQDLLQAVERFVETLATPLRVMFEAITGEERLKEFSSLRGIPLRTAYRLRDKTRRLIAQELATPTS